MGVISNTNYVVLVPLNKTAKENEETEGLRISLKFLELISGQAEIWTQGISQNEPGFLKC